MKPSEVLRAAKGLLGDEARWCKNVYARKANLDCIEWDSPEAVSFCAVGAIARVNDQKVGGHREAPKIWLARALDVEHGGGVSWWNDNSRHQDILAAFDRAIALAESEGQ